MTGIVGVASRTVARWTFGGWLALRDAGNQRPAAPGCDRGRPAWRRRAAFGRGTATDRHRIKPGHVHHGVRRPASGRGQLGSAKRSPSRTARRSADLGRSPRCGPHHLAASAWPARSRRARAVFGTARRDRARRAVPERHLQPARSPQLAGRRQLARRARRVLRCLQAPARPGRPRGLQQRRLKRTGACQPAGSARAREPARAPVLAQSWSRTRRQVSARNCS